MSLPSGAAGLIDSHCHLDYLARDGALDDALAHAQSAEMRGLLTIGTRLADAAVAEGAEIAAAHPNIWRTVGLHPHNAAEAGADVGAQLEALVDGPDVVGIGETGLDYFYDKSPRSDQARSFEAHLDVAARHDLPIVVHTRDAEDDTLAILKNHAGRVRGVIHCFTGTRRLAEESLALGFHISFSGVVTFKKAEELREIARDTPADRLLVETDSPYLAPTPKRGKPCQPAYVAYTAAVVAQARDEPLPQLAAQTTGNFFSLFERAAD